MRPRSSRISTRSAAPAWSTSRPRTPTHRRAVARCRVHMEADTASKIASGAITQGRRARRRPGRRHPGRQADAATCCRSATRCSWARCYVNFRIEDDHVEVEAKVDTVDRTGVEMEALTACCDRRAHDLRHVQVDRPEHDDRRSRALGEDRRPFRHLPPARRGPRRRPRSLTGVGGPSRPAPGPLAKVLTAAKRAVGG